jgi:hypothetical protein
MSSRMLMGLAVVLVAFIVAAVVAFQRSSVDDDPGTNATNGTNGDGTGTGNKKELPPQPLLDGWEQPAAAIVVSGEQHGYIEPCGCAKNQLGGISRRSDLIHQIAGRGWPLVALDAGGLGNDKFPTRRQSKYKFDTAVKALKDMKYAAMALGLEELKLNVDLLSYHRPSELPFLGCNVVLFDSPGLEGGPVAKVIVPVGKVRLGVTAIYGPSLKGELGQQAEITILDPAEALPRVIAELEQEKPDLLVLLSHAKLAETREIAQAFPQFDLIVSAGGPEDGLSKPDVIGKTLLVAPGAKGKHVGVVGYYPNDEKQRLRFELVDIDHQRFKDDPKMHEHMRYYQELLKEQNVAASEPAIAHASGAQFVVAEKCKDCHKKAYSKWVNSKHAHATESLVKGRKGEEATWISRIYDAECLACHVTGWSPQDVLRYESGYVDQTATPHLMGQQCENCHGPGSRHCEEEEKWKKNPKDLNDELIKWRKFHQLNAKNTEATERLCRQCHDGDNSPDFNFPKYWEQVKHLGKD